MTALRLGSLFDGIGVFPLAAVRCGIEPIWASEIEKAPISITKRHFPDMVHLGDVTKLDGREIPPVQLCHIPQMRHIGKVALGDGDRGIFDLTCPYRLNAAAHRRQRKHADPVKQAPQPERRHLICAPVP